MPVERSCVWWGPLLTPFLLVNEFFLCNWKTNLLSIIISNFAHSPVGVLCHRECDIANSSTFARFYQGRKHIKLAYAAVHFYTQNTKINIFGNKTMQFCFISRYHPVKIKLTLSNHNAAVRTVPVRLWVADNKLTVWNLLHEMWKRKFENCYTKISNRG